MRSETRHRAFPPRDARIDRPIWRPLATVAALIIAAVSCGGGAAVPTDVGGHGSRSPEQAIQAALAAMQDGNAETLRTLIDPVQRPLFSLNAIRACPALGFFDPEEWKADSPDDPFPSPPHSLHLATKVEKQDWREFWKLGSVTAWSAGYSGDWNGNVAVVREGGAYYLGIEREPCKPDYLNTP